MGFDLASLLVSLFLTGLYNQCQMITQIESLLQNKTDQRTGKSDKADETAHNLTGKHDKGSMKSYRLVHLQLLAHCIYS